MKNKFILLLAPVFFFALKTFPQALTVSSAQLNFGDVYENAPESLPLILTNTLNRTVNVYGIRFYSIYGMPAFSSADQHFSIGALASDTVWITFSPRHNIYHNSEMVIINDGLRGYTSVDLTGQGKFSNSYYDASENLSEENLKIALRTLTGAGYVSLGYNVARDSMFMTLDNKKINGQGATQNTIECIYTGRVAVGYTDRSDCQTNYSFNTEHTFPQSYFVSAEPMKSDLHHLFPTDDLANNARADNPYGYVTGGSTWSGGGSYATNTLFEPRDEQKGAAARALMYFVIRYQDYSNFFHPQETLLRTWAHDFPADTIEQTRNEIINRMQHNRNPFVDYPQFIERITSLSTTSTATPVKSIDITEDTIIYGYVSAGVNVDFNYVIVNNGTSDVALSNFNLSDPQLTFLSGGNDITVNAGESHVVLIRLNATSTATLHASLTFNSDVNAHLNVSVPIYANDSIFSVIQELSYPELDVYPNPFGEKLFLKLKNFLPAKFFIYDLTGRLMRNESIIPGLNQISTEDMKPGFYFLKVLSEDGVFIREILKK